MGDFTIVRNWGSINCYHCDNQYPKGYYNPRARMNKGHIYGPVIHFGVFRKFFAVQVPILNYSLRWINIWYCDKNRPLKGIAFALPLRGDIDAAGLNVAIR
eukprot:6722556-Pyramimonas_sp.AAC.1